MLEQESYAGAYDDLPIGVINDLLSAESGRISQEMQRMDSGRQTKLLFRALRLEWEDPFPLQKEKGSCKGERELAKTEPI